MSSITATPTATDTVGAASSTAADNQLNCGNGIGSGSSFFHLRIAAVFIILCTSSTAAIFPVIARRTALRSVIPKPLFDFAKYFGSGVIIATAFIHLLGPAITELSSPCLTGQWTVYPWPPAIAMLSIFFIFFVELFAFRWGRARLAKLGITYDPHGHEQGNSHSAHGPEASAAPENDAKYADNPNVARTTDDVEKQKWSTAGEVHAKGDATKQMMNVIENKLSTANSDEHPHTPGTVEDSALAQIIGVFTLEFGVLLHSILIGLTLAVNPSFKILFVVIVFHQLFEGLGLGSRLAYLRLPPEYNYVAIIGAILYGLTTPIGIAAGLGIRTTYNPGSMKASIVSGLMDSVSAGVLMYSGLVELLAHEFLFSVEMSNASTGKLLYACGCMCMGAGLMSLLGRWA